LAIDQPAMSATYSRVRWVKHYVIRTQPLIINLLSSKSDIALPAVSVRAHKPPLRELKNRLCHME